MWCYHSNKTSFAEPLHSATVKASFTDTRWRRTPHYYRQFSLSLGRKPDISATFNPLKTDTRLIQTFSSVHSVSILKASNCIYFFWIFNFCDFFALAYCGVVLIIQIFTLDTKWLATSTGSSYSSSISVWKVLKKKRKVVKHYVCNLSIYYNHYYLSLTL